MFNAAKVMGREICAIVFLFLLGGEMMANQATAADTFTRPVITRLCVGHRGVGYLAPENTLAAFRMAIYLGADAAECDVFRSTDGVLFLVHDINSKRTLGMGREEDLVLTEMTFAEIRSYDAGLWKGEQFRGEKVPTLDEYLELLKGTTCHPKIHLTQEGNEQKVIETVRRYGMMEETVFCTFSPTILQELRRLEPNACISLLYSEDQRNVKGTAEENAERLAEYLIKQCRELDTNIVDLYIPSVSEKLVKLLQKEGIHVWTYTLNDRASINRALDWGIESITTDRPEVFAETLKERKKKEAENQ